MDRLSSTVRHPWLILSLALLCFRIPRLLATGANNLAARALIPEWKTVGEGPDPTHCVERLRPSAAKGYLSLARHWDPAHQRVLLNRGRVAWLEGDCSTARESWTQALLAAPGDQVTVLWLLASGADVQALLPGFPAESLTRCVCSLGRLALDKETAIAWQERCFNLDPSRDAAGQLVRLYRQAGQQDQAVAVWRRWAAARPPGDAEHWWALAQAAKLEGDWEQAAEAYGQGATVSTEPYDFWMGQADCLRRLDRPRDEERAYHRAIVARPERPAPYLNLGHLWRRHGQLEGALRWYAEARNVAPRKVDPPYYLGLTHYLLEQDGQARTWFEVALRIDPQHRESHYHLAQTLYRLGDKAQAVSSLEQAIRLHSGRPWHWAVQLGDWKLDLGDRDGALAAYRQALEWKPEEATIEDRINRIEGD